MSSLEQIPERYRNRVREQDGHWIWTGAKTSSGRGSIFICGHSIQTHQFIFELLIGPVPEGMELHHKCETPLCCNPEHLEILTRLEHRRRHLRPAPTHCKRGHPYTPENTRKSKDGWHSCRTCFNEAQLRRYHERKAHA